MAMTVTFQMVKSSVFIGRAYTGMGTPIVFKNRAAAIAASAIKPIVRMFGMLISIIFRASTLTED